MEIKYIVVYITHIFRHSLKSITNNFALFGYLGTLRALQALIFTVIL